MWIVCVVFACLKRAFCTLTVAAYWIHTSFQFYQPATNRINVALLKLDRAITFSSRVGFVPLCASSHCFSAGTVGIVSGYGATQACMRSHRVVGCAQR